MSPEVAVAAATSARRNATARCVRSLFDEALASYDVSWLSRRGGDLDGHRAEPPSGGPNGHRAEPLLRFLLPGVTGRFPPLGLARGKGIRGQSGTCFPLTVAFPVPSVLL